MHYLDILQQPWYVHTVSSATALFLVPGKHSAIENSANGGSCYLVLRKFLQMIVLWEVRPLQQIYSAI